MQFLDEVVITVTSGNGGRGCVSFRREKFIPRGGPDGGDGGNGGRIIVRATQRLQTLIDYSAKKHFRAQNGAPGRGKNQTGKAGQDRVLEVPVGTTVYYHPSGEPLIDLIQDNQEVLVLPGGKGGKGNQHFATPTNRAPRIAQPGQPGQEAVLRFSLKYLADIGIIGFPNAGKSTLLSRLTTAHPRIDDYPFSTLVPNLGVLDDESGRTLTIADIPGLIEGASLGKGLGHRFLKHIERTRLLLHLIDISSRSSEAAIEDFYTLRKELENYDPALLAKAQVVLLNKVDLLEPGDSKAGGLKALLREQGIDCLSISALAGDGLETLKRVLIKKLGDEH